MSNAGITKGPSAPPGRFRSHCQVADDRGRPAAAQLHRNCGSVGLIPYYSPSPLAGAALTVKTRGGDNLAILRTYDFCRPGHVTVVDARVVLQSQNLAVHVH